MNLQKEKADGLQPETALDTASNRANHTGNSTEAQRIRLLAYLQENAAITTLEARKLLDVLHPAMRILELRANGWFIDTIWVHQATDCGKSHRVAKYVLVSGVAA